MLFGRSQIVLGEMERTEGWVNKHISDTCGYHYRRFLLECLAARTDTLYEQFSIKYLTLLEKEHGFILDLIHTFPAHEAMWVHR